MKNKTNIVNQNPNSQSILPPATSLQPSRTPFLPLLGERAGVRAGVPLTNPQFILLAALLVILLAAAPGCALRQAYPETQIRGYINGQPFSVNAPKDSTLAGFDAIAETNGAIHVHIDSLQCSLHPTNLANAAAGQAAIVTATASAINQAMQNAATIALKAAAAAAP